ncbi:MAG: Uma2 family endonuclease [Planctomycetes bacterium]|nr:Uma2 family endonuclease [Planctomycetota bacterium]
MSRPGLMRAPASAPLPQLARIHVDQYHRMLETGILSDGDPVELLDGLLVFKDRSSQGEDPMTVGHGHSLAVKLLAGLDPRVRSHGYHVQTQQPLTLPPENEPEPDGAIVRGQVRDYAAHHPGAADTPCVFEVADSSLTYDRTTKLQLYATAAIAQYVLVNLVDRRVDVFEGVVPGEARYRRTTVFEPGQTFQLTLGSGVGLELKVDELLP